MIFFDPKYVAAIVILSVLFWTLVPVSYRSKFIIAASFAGLAFIQLQFTLFLTALVFFVYLGARLIERTSSLRWFFAMLLTLVVVLFGFKYMGVLFGLIFSAESSFSKAYLVPLGISYLSFKLIAFILDVYRGTIKDPSFEELLAFIFFLPIFPAGPIERFQDFAGKRAKDFDWERYIGGLQRITLGYFKKVVIVNFVLNEIVFKHLYPVVVEGGVSFDLSASLVVVYLVGALIYAYVDLSSYADIAIGFGRLYGYDICENMNYPIFARNLGEYWTRWHMSLSNWCRNNVYFPILGSTKMSNLGLYGSFIVMGMWHYLSLNWFFWGLWHASGIIVYQKWSRFKRKKFKGGVLPRRVGYVVGVVITVVYSGLGFSFITMGSAQESFRLLLAIFL